MNEPWTHEADDDSNYIEPAPATVKRGNRIAGWTALVISALLTAYAIKLLLQ